MVVLMGMTLLPRVYSQQEVDPTWYNPWPAASKDVPHSTHARPANTLHRRKVTAMAPGQLHVGKRRRKRVVDRRGTASLHLPAQSALCIDCKRVDEGNPQQLGKLARKDSPQTNP